MRRGRYTFACFNALAFLVAVASTFAPGARTADRIRRPFPFPAFDSKIGGKIGTTCTASQNANEPERELTLYDVLNASPDDSQQQLRRRYIEAARLTHPDSARSGEPQVENKMADFREIAAAWNVLSDPKERLKYDRSLKAKELTDGVGSLIDAGFSAAVPFLFEKAPQQINKTATDMGKTMRDVGERFEKTRKIADLNRKSSDMARRATSETKRVQELQARISSDRALGALRDANLELTSAQARRIIQSFDFLRDAGDSASANKTIDIFEKVEGDFKEKTDLYQSIKTNVTMIKEKLDFARRDGQVAEERLGEALRKLGEAQSAREQSEVSHKEAIQKGKQAAAKIDVTVQKMDSARRVEQVAKEQFEEARRIFEEARAVREKTEKTHEEAVLQKKQAAKNVDMIEEKMSSTRREQQLAEDRLEEARQKLVESQSAREQSENTYKDVVLQEKLAMSSVNSASAMLKTHRQKVRQALRETEGLNNAKENAYLEEEKKKLEDLASKLQAKADELREKANELKQQIG